MTSKINSKFKSYKNWFIQIIMFSKVTDKEEEIIILDNKLQKSLINLNQFLDNFKNMFYKIKSNPILDKTCSSIIKGIFILNSVLLSSLLLAHMLINTIN